MSVYFISARELDLVKIGYAYNPLHRFNHLRTFSPVELTLEGAIPGTRTKERELHKRFALARVRGEWFKLTPGLRAEIDNSSRPEEFTRIAVKKWIRALIEEDTERERQVMSPAAIAQVEKRLQDELEVSARRALMSELERRELDGDIFFPFRQFAETES
jgi:hypothetical protein